MHWDNPTSLNAESCRSYRVERIPGITIANCQVSGHWDRNTLSDWPPFPWSCLTIQRIIFNAKLLIGASNFPSCLGKFRPLINIVQFVSPTVSSRHRTPTRAAVVSRRYAMSVHWCQYSVLENDQSLALKQMEENSWWDASSSWWHCCPSWWCCSSSWWYSSSSGIAAMHNGSACHRPNLLASGQADHC